jgi:hypothetical protein
VRVLVTATNPDGSAGVPSAATATVPSAPPVNTAAPVVTVPAPPAQRAALLFVSQGTWSGIGNTYTYRWQRSADGITWSDVSGATAATYIPGVADENLLLSAVVTATNPDATVSAPSAPTGAILGAPPVVSARPTLTGTAQRTATLTTTNGTWSGGGNTYAYSWQRSADGGTTWADIAGAGGSAYTLTAADEGMLVRSFVTVTNLDGSAGIGSAPTCLRRPSTRPSR